MTAVNFRDHRIYLVHLLRALHRRGPGRPAAIYEEVADSAGITAEQRAVQSKDDSHHYVYRNRIQFARQSLVDAEAVIGSTDPGWQRGVWQLTSEGQKLAEEIRSDSELDKILRERADVGLRRRREQTKESRALAGLDQEDSADDGAGALDPGGNEVAVGPTIRDRVDTANQDVLTTMLDHVRGMDETAFEHLVGRVLKAALRAESVRVTRRSRDGGIDGVLHFDALGMRTAVFQAKCYSEGNVVSRPSIDAFSTAARRSGAAFSLFVTSSRFSSEAVEAAGGENIRLIDGTAFVDLMAQHGIGLRPRDSFVLYEIDSAWSMDLDDGG